MQPLSGGGLHRQLGAAVGLLHAALPRVVLWEAIRQPSFSTKHSHPTLAISPRPCSPRPPATAFHYQSFLHQTRHYPFPMSRPTQAACWPSSSFAAFRSRPPTHTLPFAAFRSHPPTHPLWHPQCRAAPTESTNKAPTYMASHTPPCIAHASMFGPERTDTSHPPTSCTPTSTQPTSHQPRTTLALCLQETAQERA